MAVITERPPEDRILQHAPPPSLGSRGAHTYTDELPHEPDPLVFTPGYGHPFPRCPSAWKNRERIQATNAYQRSSASQLTCSNHFFRPSYVNWAMLLVQ